MELFFPAPQNEIEFTYELQRQSMGNLLICALSTVPWRNCQIAHLCTGDNCLNGVGMCRLQKTLACKPV